MRSNAIPNRENIDKYFILRLILAYLHPCEINRPPRLRNYIQYLNELNVDGFDFWNGFKCSGVHDFEKPNNLSSNEFQINFYQDKSNWKHNLNPIEIGKTNSDRVVDLLFYKNHYVLIEKLHVFF